MSTGAIIAVGAVGVMVCCSASSAAAVMMGGDDESNVGKVCTPQGTPDPNATYKYGANDACLMTCKTGYEKKDGACVEKTPAPGPATMLEDGQPYAYEEGKLYQCTSGKAVGCLFRNESAGIAAAAGVYDSATKKCSQGDHVYCMNDKTITMAQYSDNTPAGTGTWQQTMHRYSAEGKACPTPEAAKCQDDQSIASYTGWGGGNTAKITTMVTNRQCVDNSFLYC